MQAIRLLVLGAVRQHGRAHGYAVRNDLEFWGAHRWSNAKPGSIYHALGQLTRRELLRAHDTAPSTAGGPPRTEYELTPAGEEEFQRLLRHALTAVDEKPDVLTAGIGFLVDLPREEAVALLGQRVAALEAWRAEVARDWLPEEEGSARPHSHIGEIMRRWVHDADSDVRWAHGLMERLRGGTYVMAGEGERTAEVLPEGTEDP